MRKKKFKSIGSDIDPVVSQLENGNFLGDEITGLSLPETQSSFKVRVANSDTKVGQSNGYRMIYYVVKDEKVIYLLTLYYKKDKEDISNREIVQLIKDYCL